MAGAIRANRLVYVMGGVCGIALGIAYLVIIVLYAPIGAPPARVDALLTYLGANPVRWWWIISLSVLTDFLFVPLAFSIYSALKSVRYYMVWLATACTVLFVVLDLAITWTNYASLMALSRSYMIVVSEAERAPILTSAMPASALLHSNLFFVYNTLTLALGILLSGFAMLRSAFGNRTAYLGIATGCAGIISVIGSFFVSALSSLIILASCLTTLWVIVVGYGLCRRRIDA